MTPISKNDILCRWPGVARDIDVIRGDFPGGNCEFFYAREPLGRFSEVADDMAATYPLFPKDKRRTAKITSKLRGGEESWPIFVEADSLFIVEGRHRVVAFRACNMPFVDVIYVMPAISADDVLCHA